jgi:hypothetical protein
MAQAGLLGTVCTVALLAAAPAFAQTDTRPAQTGPDSTVQDNTVPNNRASMPGARDSTMSPGMRADSSGAADSSGSMDHHSTHRSATLRHEGAMRGGSDSSQNAAVDRLNEQSFQAAQNGQSFTGMNNGGMSSGGMNSGGMNSGGMSSGGMNDGRMHHGPGGMRAMPGSGSLPGGNSTTGSSTGTGDGSGGAM